MIAKAKRPSILVVDDEPLVLMTAMDMLDDLGFTAVPAPNADEAISALEQHDDVLALFTDINMPGSMDGVALAAFVKRRWPPVKILIASGHPLNEPNLLPHGSCFLRKPYDVRALENSLHDVFA